MLEIKLARLEDAKMAYDCILDAKVFLKQSGSPQWNENDGYPNYEDILEDIENQSLYIAVVDDRIAGIMALLGEEDNYQRPYGKWLIDTKNYVTIHRLAMKQEFRGKGISKYLLEYAEAFARENHKDSIRIDTHEKNNIVNHLASSMGYTLCGYVLYSKKKTDPKRLIYEKVVK